MEKTNKTTRKTGGNKSPMKNGIQNLKNKFREKQQQKKCGKSGPDSDGEDDENITIEMDEDEDTEYETASNSTEEEEGSKKSQEEGSEVSSSEDQDYEDSEDSDEGSNISPRELRKTIAALFPSNYINQKVRADNKKMSTRSSFSSAHKKKGGGSGGSKTKNHRKSASPSSDEEDSEEDSDEDSDDEDDDDSNDFNIIFRAFGGGGSAESDRIAEDKQAIRDDEDEDCNSEDEKTFMKETYEHVLVPTIDSVLLDTSGNTIAVKGASDESKTGTSKKSSSSSSSDKKKKRRNKSDEAEASPDSDPAEIEAEYKELVDLKKHLLDKLAKKPTSKILIHALEECRTSIQKLVKKTRMQNAKKYYKMVNGKDEQQTSEIDYFKKKLSNKEQLRAMKELNDINEHITIKKPYRLTLLDSNIPAKYKATVMQKLNMLRSMEPGDPEYYKLKTWVDTFMRVPFSVHNNLSVSISDGIDKCSEFMSNAKQILDDCVYGLDDAKMQILQMVGQWITNPSAMGSAIAIKGPPGTGKTSLVKEGISKILGREFAFIALGGTGDASFLEGHSYTYEGSMWGKIVQILIDSKCMNPVIYFDELDKISDTPRGEEIVGILTHLTDTTQNNQFHDKYFSEVDFDLSKCLFIFSYNDESKVNPILRDRMYRIQTKGYDAKEKGVIARQFLLPKIREQVSFSENDIIIPDETLQFIISNQSMTMNEAGVRNMKRCLEIIHTKLNLFRLMKPGQNLFTKDMDLAVEFPFTVSKKHVETLIKNEETQNQSLLAMYV